MIACFNIRNTYIYEKSNLTKYFKICKICLFNYTQYPVNISILSFKLWQIMHRVNYQWSMTSPDLSTMFLLKSSVQPHPVDIYVRVPLTSKVCTEGINLNISDQWPQLISSPRYPLLNLTHVGITCETLLQDWNVQVTWKYIKVNEYSNQLCTWLHICHLPCITHTHKDKCVKVLQKYIRCVDTVTSYVFCFYFIFCSILLLPASCTQTLLIS